MRTLIGLATLSISLLVALPGCPGLGCGALQGGADMVYQRGSNDLIILCDTHNTYVERLNGQPQVDGFAEYDTTDSQIIHATVDGTTQVAFTMTMSENVESATAPELGSGTFQLVNLDPTDLDHANTMCVQLQSLAWYTQVGPQ